MTTPKVIAPRRSFSTLVDESRCHCQPRFQIILPCLFITMAMVFIRMKPTPSNEPSLLLTPDMYGPDAAMFFTDHVGNDVTRKMSASLTEEPGVGTTCMQSTER